MKFNYQIKTPEGQSLIGSLEASNKEAALSFLQEKGMVVVALDEEKQSLLNFKINFGGVGFDDVMNFTTQLSILFKSSVPLTESLKTIAKMTPNEAMKEKVSHLAEKVAGGTPLSKALEDFPKIFDHFYINMMKAGEAAGKLSENLDAMATHLQNEKELRDKISGATVYPMFILGVFGVVGVIMIKYIIPQFRSVIEGFAAGGMELPALTKMIFSTADVMEVYGFWVILGIIAVIFGAWRYSKTKEGKELLDRLIIRVWLIGDLVKKVNVSNFAESMSTMVKAGIPISQSLEITASLMNNVVYKDIVNDLRQKVMKGMQMSYVLKQYPNEIPPLLTQMVMVGERTGSLESTLEKVVYFYRKEVYKTTDIVVSLIQPIFLLILGLVIGFLVVGMYYPLITMMGQL